MLLNAVKSLLSNPLSRNLQLDSVDTTIVRARIIREKPFLRKLYRDNYQAIINALPSQISGSVLELGSGGGFLKGCYPDLLTSDVLALPQVDIVLDGRGLPFDRASLGAIVMMDVFHHIPEVRSLLSEAARCVESGGAMVMIEPWNTRWSRLVYRKLHHEPFEPEAKGWNLPPGGPLSQANSALTWIVFEHDREIFKREFPQWELKDIVLHSPFCYILSGGVALRALLPGACYNLCRRLESLFNPRVKDWAMFATITLIRKRDMV